MRQAAGILAIAKDTKKLCLAWRSPKVKDGNRWGLIGGSCEPDETPEETAIAELGEEVGYYGPIQLDSGFVDRLTGFEYHSFLGMVPTAFPFNPEPEFAWELSCIVWMEYARFVSLIEDFPGTFHKGILKFYHESRNSIINIIQS